MTHGLDTYDYGTRQLWPVLPVWDRVDPLCEKYAYASPYCYCLDNPVDYIDSDGNDVLIWYQDKQGRDRSFRYDGSQKMVPANSFVMDFIHTYNYLKFYDVGFNVVNAVKDHSVLIELQNDDNDTNYQNIDRRPTVFWQSRKGIILTNGRMQSPAVRLEHEFDHAMDAIRNCKNHNDRRKKADSQYENAEERRVIEGSETKTAKKLHQGVRKDHYGTTYTVKDPRFIK